MQVIEPPKKVAQSRAVPSIARGQKISFGNKVSPHRLCNAHWHQMLCAVLLCSGPAQLDCTPAKERGLQCCA